MSRIIAERWSACPPGELDRLEAYLRRARRRTWVGTMAAALAATVAVAFASWMVADAVQPPKPIRAPRPGPCPVILPCQPGKH